jgi:hypothetical protein
MGLSPDIPSPLETVFRRLVNRGDRMKINIAFCAAALGLFRLPPPSDSLLQANLVSLQAQ